MLGKGQRMRLLQFHGVFRSIVELISFSTKAELMRRSRGPQCKGIREDETSDHDKE